MSALRRRFETLRWRLMLACFVAAFTAMMTLALIFFLVPSIAAVNAPQRPTALVQGLRPLAARIAPLVQQPSPNRAQVREALTAASQPIVLNGGPTDNVHNSITITPGRNAALFVLDSGGQTLAALMPSAGVAGDLAHIEQSAEAKSVIAAALRNATETSDLIQAPAGGPTVAAVPIPGADGSVRGVLLIGADVAALLRPGYLVNLLALFPTAILFGLIASVFGAVFGMLTARGLTRRLLRLTSAADAWSKGDFTVAAHDRSSDELGQLARDLNRMAEQLQNLLRDRQQLAVVEERNRLARELHDSVKQQMFALTMLMGSAQLEVAEQSEAKRLLGEAERIASNAQQELTALIQALRPVALANKGLGVALREFCDTWQRRTGIACNVQVSAALAISPDAEQQVFRVAQEALANIAKHSGATRVEISAADEQGTLALRIRDNGHGFDVTHAEGRGLGLSSMRERVEQLGGSLRIDSAAGGTRLDIRVPLAQPESHPPNSSTLARDASRVSTAPDAGQKQAES